MLKANGRDAHTTAIIWKNDDKFMLSVTFFMNVKALIWKETFALPFLFFLPPEGDVVVAVFTLGLPFSDSSSSLVNEASASHDSSLAGTVLTVEITIENWNS